MSRSKIPALMALLVVSLAVSAQTKKLSDLPLRDKFTGTETVIANDSAGRSVKIDGSKIASKNYVDAKDANTLSQSKSYADGKVTDVSANLNRFASPQKTYPTLAAMQADMSPKAADGQAFAKGWMANIVTSPAGGANDQEFYYWENTGVAATNWKYGGKAGATQDLTPYAKNGGSTKTLKDVDDYAVSAIQNGAESNIAKTFETSAASLIVSSPANIEPSVIDLPDDANFKPFTKGMALNIKETAETYNSRGYINLSFPYAKEYTITFWQRILATAAGAQTGIEINAYGGNNNAVGRYSFSSGISYAAFTSSIKPVLDAGEVYSGSNAYATIKTDKYFMYDGQYYIHRIVSVSYEPADPVNFIRLSMGWTYNATYAQRNNVEALFFGIQYKTGTDAVFGHACDTRFISGFNRDQAPVADYDNLMIDNFRGGGFYSIAMPNSNVTSIHQLSDRGVSFFKDYKTETIRSGKFGEIFKISRKDGQPFIRGNNSYIFQVQEGFYNGSKTGTKIRWGFWIDRRCLKDATLWFNNNSSQAIWSVNASMLSCEGVRLSSPNPENVRVLAVDGDYSFLAFDQLTRVFRFFIGTEGSMDVTGLIITNPVMIQVNGEEEQLNPYYRYRSRAEKNGSRWIGKNAVIMGDSQYNVPAAQYTLVRETGLNIYDAHAGGHFIRFRNGDRTQTTEFNGVSRMNSFYGWDNRRNVLGLVKRNAEGNIVENGLFNGETVDMWLLNISSNDGAGGGELTTDNILYVRDNYPYYGDDDVTAAAKLASFASLPNADIDGKFPYIVNFAAYLRQIRETYPNALVMLGSINIGSGSGTIAGGQWVSPNNPDNTRERTLKNGISIRSQIEMLCDWYSCMFVDLFRDANLTYEKLPMFESDGVHWGNTVKERIGMLMSAKILQQKPDDMKYLIQ